MGVLSGARGSQSPQSLPLAEGPWVHVRREPFEFGLLPIPSLMHKEGAVDVLRSLRTRLLQTSNPSASGVASALVASASGDADMLDARVSSKALATCLNLPESQATLILETLGSILPIDTEDIDPLAQVHPATQRTSHPHTLFPPLFSLYSIAVPSSCLHFSATESGVGFEMEERVSSQE